MSPYSDESEIGNHHDTRIHRKSKEGKKKHKRRLDDESDGKTKKSARGREYSSDDDSATEDKVVQKGHKKGKGRLNKDFDGDMDGKSVSFLCGWLNFK